MVGRAASEIIAQGVPNALALGTVSTANIERRTPNTERRIQNADSEFDVGRSTLGVRRFLLVLERSLLCHPEKLVGIDVRILSLVESRHRLDL